MELKDKIDFLNETLKLWENNKKSWNMVELFDSSGMSSSQIREFLRNSNQEHNFNHDFIIETAWDVKKEISWDDYRDINEILDYAFYFEKKYIPFLKRYLRCYCAFMVLYVKSTDGSQLRESTLNANAFREYLSSDNQDSYFNYYYRGQTNYDWDLIPSIYRNYIFRNGDSGDYIDSSMLFGIYDSEDLVKKYDMTISPNATHLSTITYNFLAYMQHSVSFSPLIDFTDKREIASTFALGNKADFNSFSKYDSSIFKLGLAANASKELNDEKDINIFFSRDYNIKMLNGKIKLGTIMIIAKNDFSQVSIDCTNIQSIIDELRPKYKIINVATNDRMKYQHGKFLVFYDCLVVDGKILFNLNRDIQIEKIKILRKSKNGFYQFLMKNYEHYNMEYLLNPYLYFSK